MGLSWLAILPVLSLLVFVHELGHFVVARFSKVKVEEFAFGFPPRVVAVRRGETTYAINLIPFGGYVKMLGENGDSQDPRSFGARPAWQRAAVLCAGSIMNVVLAVVLFATAFGIGQPVPTGRVEVAEVMANTPAFTVGLQKGDLILKIDGIAITRQEDVRDLTRERLGREMTLTVERAGQVLPAIKVVPRANPPANQGPMGIVTGAEIKQESYPWWKSLGLGAKRTAQVFVLIPKGFVAMFQGTVKPDVVGPVGIVQITSEVARTGFIYLIDFTAFLSINLFLVNMLPFPALDGGRLVFVAVEVARRGRRLDPRREGLLHFVGWMIIIGFMVVVSYRDVLRIMSGESLLP